MITVSYVVQQLQALLPAQSRRKIFSQQILAYYGFLFPVMIRLKVLHRHLLNVWDSKDNLGKGSSDMSSGDPSGPMKVSEVVEIKDDESVDVSSSDVDDYGRKEFEERKRSPHFEFNAKVIINSMTLETFLRVVSQNQT